MDEDYEALLIAIKLSKNGYGSPADVMQWDSMDVVVALEYEKFLIDYEHEFSILNKETGI